MKKILLPILLALVGCAAPMSEEIGEPAAEFADGPEDSVTRPTVVGEIGTFQTVYGQVAPPNQAFPAYQLKLEKPAKLTFTTGAGSSGALALDTVLYLYKQSGSSFRQVARDDNGAGIAKYSKIESSLEAGTYRVVVAAANRRAAGRFSVQTRCTGLGCGLQTQTCVFNEDTNFDNLQRFTSAAQIRAYQRTDADIVAKLQQAALATGNVLINEVDTIEGLIEASADGWQIDSTTVGNETFYKIAFYPGDNEYGIIIDGNDTQVAKVGDGDIFSCIVFKNPPEVAPTRDCASAAMRAFDELSDINPRLGSAETINLLDAHSDREIIKLTTNSATFLVSAESFGGSGCMIHGIQNAADKTVLFPEVELDLVQRFEPFTSHPCSAPLKAYIGSLENISHGGGFTVSDLRLRTAPGPNMVFGEVKRGSETTQYRATVSTRTTSQGAMRCEINAVGTASAAGLAQ